MKKIKIDSRGRIYIPTEIRELLNAKEELSYTVSVTKGTMTLFSSNYSSIKVAIAKRLENKGISKEERNFLNKLLLNNELGEENVDE